MSSTEEAPRPTPDHVANLTRRADDIVSELDEVVRQMADLLRRRAE